MKMIGLKDVTLNATDEFGRSQLINFNTDKEVDVPDAFVGTAKAIGYAKLAEPVEQPSG
jgi:hypothetical protein